MIIVWKLKINIAYIMNMHYVNTKIAFMANEHAIYV